MNEYSREVLLTAVAILDTIGDFVNDFDKAVAMAKGRADELGLKEPKASWFVGDVLNAANEMDAADEL